MIDATDVRNALKKILRNEEPLSWSEDFNFRLEKVDSLDHLSLAMLLEETYNVKIANEDLPKLKTIGDVIQHVRKIQKPV